MYYNLALRNSDLRDKDSEKLYYCVLKNRGVLDQDTFVNYLSQITGIKEAICLGVLSKLGAAHLCLHNHFLPPNIFWQ